MLSFLRPRRKGGKGGERNTQIAAAVTSHSFDSTLAVRDFYRYRKQRGVNLGIDSPTRIASRCTCTDNKL